MSVTPRARSRAFALLAHAPTARLVHAACTLGLPEALRLRRCTEDELAATIQAHQPSLNRLLTALRSIGALRTIENGHVEFTPVGEALTETPLSVLHQMASGFCGSFWGDLAESVHTGRPAFETSHGQGFFEYVAAHPERSREFTAGMEAGVAQSAPRIVEICDLSRFEHVVDVGGGTGGLIREACRRFPSIRGTLVDLPHVVAALRPEDLDCGTNAIDAVSLDILRDPLPNADALLVRAVVHDFDDANAARILTSCRDALSGDHARVFVIEMLLPATPRPHPAYFTDLDLMVITSGGRERTLAEYRALARNAGLVICRVRRAPPFAVLECRRA